MTKPKSFVHLLCRKIAVIPVFAISVFLFGSKTSAQQTKDVLDTSIRRMLERNIVFPESLFKGKDGFALLYLYKSKGSIVIKSLYSSYRDYNFGVDQTLTEVANRNGLAANLSQSELIVPVIYQYFDGVHREADLRLTAEAKKVISQLGLDIDLNTPVIMIGGPTK